MARKTTTKQGRTKHTRTPHLNRPDAGDPRWASAETSLRVFVHRSLVTSSIH